MYRKDHFYPIESLMPYKNAILEDRELQAELKTKKY